MTLSWRPAADPFKRWESANVVVGVAKGTVSALAYAKLGDITADQFRSSPPSCRTSASTFG